MKNKERRLLLVLILIVFLSLSLFLYFSKKGNFGDDSVMTVTDKDGNTITKKAEVKELLTDMEEKIISPDEQITETYNSEDTKTKRKIMPKILVSSGIIFIFTGLIFLFLLWKKRRKKKGE